MMKKFQHLKDNIVSIIVITLVGFLLGYFVTQLGVNNLTTSYELSLTSNKDLNEFMTYEFFEDSIEKIDEYNKTAKENGLPKKRISKVDYESLLNDLTLVKNNDQYTIKVKAKYYPTTALKSSGKLNLGKDRFESSFKSILSYTDANLIYDEDIKTTGYNNPYLYGGISGAVTFLIFSLFIMFYGNPKINLNATMSIFSKEYWKSAFGLFKKVKNITLIAVLFALMMLCKLIALPSGFGMLGISFTYIFFSIITMIFGPISGIIIGFCSDMIGYFLTQSAYQIFFGYTLNAMLAGFTYGICFYKRRITFTKCLYARLFVNLVINVGLGSLWWKILYDLNMEGFYSYMFLISLPKNLLYLLPQAIVLYLVIKIIIKPLAQLKLVDKEISKNVTLI